MNFLGKKEIDKLWEKLREVDLDIDSKLRILEVIGMDCVIHKGYLAMCVSGAIVGFIADYCVRANKLSAYLIIISIIISMAIAYFVVVKIADYIIVEKYIYQELRKKYCKDEAIQRLEK
ncbi:MAG: hypothetical protein RSG48_06745 [Clostridia bacterium]